MDWTKTHGIDMDSWYILMVFISNVVINLPSGDTSEVLENKSSFTTTQVLYRLLLLYEPKD